MLFINYIYCIFLLTEYLLDSINEQLLGKCAMPISKKIVNIKGKLIAGDTSCDGLIESCTEDKVCMRVPSLPHLEDVNEESLMLYVDSSSENPLCLNCKVQWTYKNPPYGLTRSIGMKVKSPLQHYKEFYESL